MITKREIGGIVENILALSQQNKITWEKVDDMILAPYWRGEIGDYTFTVSEDLSLPISCSKNGADFHLGSIGDAQPLVDWLKENQINNPDSIGELNEYLQSQLT